MSFSLNIIFHCLIKKASEKLGSGYNFIDVFKTLIITLIKKNMFATYLILAFIFSDCNSLIALLLKELSLILKMMIDLMKIDGSQRCLLSFFDLKKIKLLYFNNSTKIIML